MGNFKEYYDETVRWNQANGIDRTIESQRAFCTAETEEFNAHPKVCQAKLIEAGDMLFVISYYHYLIKSAGLIDYHTGYSECLVLVKKLNAERYVKAVIKSNWSKYMPVNRYSLKQASIEAVKASKAYEGRYTAIVPVLTTCKGFYFLQGTTQQGNLKVIKPSCYISAEKFLS